MLLVGMILFGGIFNGCTTAQRKEIYSEIKEWGIDEFNKLKPQIMAIVDAKLVEKEAAQLAELDKTLALFKSNWTAFDADKDGHLSLAEVGQASMFITTEGGKKVISGEWTVEKTKDVGKGAVGALALLALIAAARKVTASKTPPAEPTGGK